MNLYPVIDPSFRLMKRNNFLFIKRTILLLLFMISIINSYSQVQCVNRVTRTGNHVIYKKSIVKIFSGQRVLISSSNNGGKLKGLSLIDSSGSHITDFLTMSATIEQHNSEKNICIDLNLIKPENDKPMTVMLFHNPYKKRLSYKAKIYSPERKKYIRTPVLPIMPGISGILTWPYLVPSIILYKLKMSRE